MASQFLMQVVDRETQMVVQWEPGQRIEREFVDDVVTKLSTRRIGWFVRRSTVLDVVRQAFLETIFELKAKVDPK